MDLLAHAINALAQHALSILSHLVHLSIAYAMALPIGWNREREAHAAGIRTFPIVAVASCGLVMMGAALPGVTADSQSRLVQGLVTGIGFVGAGAILKDRGKVSGTATAASVWNIGIVGAAVGFGNYDIAFVLVLFNFITLRVLLRAKGNAAGVREDGEV